MTLAQQRQKHKHFLTVYRTILSGDLQNVSFPIVKKQWVTGAPFLIVKTHLLISTPERAPSTQAKASEVGIPFQERNQQSKPVDKYLSG